MATRGPEMPTHEQLRNAVMAHDLAHGTPATPLHVGECLHAEPEACRVALSGAEVGGVEVVRTGDGWGFEPSKEFLRQSYGCLLRALDGAAA